MAEISRKIIEINEFTDEFGVDYLNSILPQRFVIAFKMAKAVQTPFPHPDISSPINSFGESFLHHLHFCSNPQIKNEEIRHRLRTIRSCNHIRNINPNN